MYNTSQTAANLLSDIVAILTGETNVANLSAGCDKANTELLSTYSAAGWTLHDNAAGTNAKCLKAVIADDATKFKYMVIDTNTAGTILQKTYETWNETTHVGTNLCYASDIAISNQRYNLATGGRLDITASIRHCAMFAYVSAIYGSSQYVSASGVFERTRKSGWDTVANAYPPFLWLHFSGATGGYSPRVVGGTGSDVTSSSASYSIITPYGAITSGPSLMVPKADKTLGHQLLPFGVHGGAYGNLGGDISSYCNMYFTTMNYGAAYDELVVNGENYIIWTGYSNTRVAVRKG